MMKLSGDDGGDDKYYYYSVHLFRSCGTKQFLCFLKIFLQSRNYPNWLSRGSIHILKKVIPRVTCVKTHGDNVFFITSNNCILAAVIAEGLNNTFDGLFHEFVRVFLGVRSSGTKDKPNVKF